MSEDVLERVRVFVMSQEPWRAIEALRLIDALAAEVRALRKDRERLDWLELHKATVWTMRAHFAVAYQDEYGEELVEAARDIRVAIDVARASVGKRVE